MFTAVALFVLATLAGPTTTPAPTATPSPLGTAASTPPDSADEHAPARRKTKDVVVFGEDKTIGPGELVEGDLVVFGGNAVVDGNVTGDLVCFGGHIKLGPQAVIGGDLVSMGGHLDVDRQATIRGSQVTMGPRFTFPDLRPVIGRRHSELHDGPGFRLVRLAAEVGFLLLLSFVALLLTVFVPRQLERIAEHLSGDFPRCALGALAAMVLLPLGVLVLILTCAGIPLVPLLLLVAAVAALFGDLAFAKVLGHRLAPARGELTQILMGLMLLDGASLMGAVLAMPGGAFVAVGNVFRVIGAVILIGASFIGLGAVFYSRWGKRTLGESLAARGAKGTAPATP